METPDAFSDFATRSARYWDELAGEYQRATTISVKDFHYGPLLPGDGDLALLPQPLAGKRCLELGCGAAQNSIFLAKNGAICTAIDVSERQIHFARELSAGHGVELDLRIADMENLPTDSPSPPIRRPSCSTSPNASVPVAPCWSAWDIPSSRGNGWNWTTMRGAFF